MESAPDQFSFSPKAVGLVAEAGKSPAFTGSFSLPEGSVAGPCFQPAGCSRAHSTLFPRVYRTVASSP